MPFRLTLVFKVLPTMSFGWGQSSWQITRWNKERWIGRVHRAVSMNRPSKPLEKAQVILLRYSSAEPDFDNLISGFKPILNALVKERILKDDSPKVIGHPIYQWIKAKPKKGKIVIAIIEN